MTQLTAAQRASLHTQLLDLVTRLRGEIATALHGSDPVATPGLANHHEDTDDDAVASLETSVEVAAIERDMRELRAAESALERLAKSEYGICVECGAGIPLGRLLASPAASQCIDCQSNEEREQGKTGRRSL